jgi:predicted nucleotidyltransferase
MGDMKRVRSQIETETLNAISAFMERISSAYPVSSARLYGSRARGDHAKHSDADIAVFLKGARRAQADLLSTKLAMADVAFEILLDTNVLISPLPIWENDWRHPESHENPRLLENIRREGVVL